MWESPCSHCLLLLLFIVHLVIILYSFYLSLIPLMWCHPLIDLYWFYSFIYICFCITSPLLCFCCFCHPACFYGLLVLTHLRLGPNVFGQIGDGLFCNTVWVTCLFLFCVCVCVCQSTYSSSCSHDETKNHCVLVASQWAFYKHRAGPLPHLLSHFPVSTNKPETNKRTKGHYITGSHCGTWLWWQLF